MLGASVDDANFMDNLGTAGLYDRKIHSLADLGPTLVRPVPLDFVGPWDSGDAHGFHNPAVDAVDADLNFLGLIQSDMDYRLLVSRIERVGVVAQKRSKRSRGGLIPKAVAGEQSSTRSAPPDCCCLD